MSKFTRIFIKIIVLLIYVIFIMDFLTPPYNYEIGGMTFLNVPIAIYLEILGYLICGIFIGFIIGESVDDKIFSHKIIMVLILILLAFAAFLKPIYFWTKGLVSISTLVKEMYFNVILGIALGIIICLRINKWIERK